MQVDVRQQRRNYCPLRRPYLRLRPFPFFRHSRLQPFLDQANDAPVRDPMLEKLHQPFVRNIIEKSTNVQIEHPVHSPPPQSHPERVQRIMLASPWPEPIGESQKVLFINLIEN